MSWYVFSIVLIVLSNVFYNICQKSTPVNAHPLVALLVTYLVAAIITAVMIIWYRPENGFLSSLGDLNWTSFALGVAIVGLELGFLLAYRTGWDISIGSLVSNILLAILLIPVGIFLYSEALSWNKVAGVFLCLIGMFMINR